MPDLRLHTYSIAPEVTAFSTTRHGGVGSGAYASFNINRYCGDDPAAVEANRCRLAAALGIDGRRIVVPHQVHGTEVRRIAPELFDMPAAVREMLLDGVDAVMTDMKGVCVGVSTADCVPLLLYDAAHGACCAVHAGWRGTLGRIAAKALEAMAAAYGTRGTDVRAVVGPGISLRNFEVGDEVYDMFRQAAFPMEAVGRRYEKWHIDLPECNRLQLLEAGVPHDSIHIDGTCTFDSTATFFSARRMGTQSGRIYTAIMMGRG